MHYYINTQNTIIIPLVLKKSGFGMNVFGSNQPFTQEVMRRFRKNGLLSCVTSHNAKTVDLVIQTRNIGKNTESYSFQDYYNLHSYKEDSQKVQKVQQCVRLTYPGKWHTVD